MLVPRSLIREIVDEHRLSPTCWPRDGSHGIRMQTSNEDEIEEGFGEGLEGRCEPGEHSLHSPHADLQFDGSLVDSCQVGSQDSSFSWSLIGSFHQELAAVRCPA